MILGISYFDIFCIVVIVSFFLIFWRLNVWYNKKHNVPKVFQWFPRKWGKRKVSEHLSQLNEKLAAEGKGIWGYNLCYRFIHCNYSLYSQKIQILINTYEEKVPIYRYLF